MLGVWAHSQCFRVAAGIGRIEQHPWATISSGPAKRIFYWRLLLKHLKSVSNLLVFITFLIIIYPNQTLGWEKVKGPWNDDADKSFFTIAIHPTQPEIIFIGSNKLGPGLYRSPNKGKTWEEANNGIGIGLFQSNPPPISKIVFSPSNPNTMYLGTAYDCGILGACGKIYKSTNLGNSWAEVTGEKNWLGVPQIQGPILDVSVDSLNPDIVVVGTGGQGVLKSINGGQSWTNIFNATSMIGANDFFNIVKINPFNSNDILISGFRYYSENVIPNPACLVGQCDQDTIPGTIGSLPLGLKRSINNGNDWQELTIFTGLDQPLITDLSFSSASSELFISTMTYITPLFIPINNKGIFKSLNGGDSWQPINNSTSGDLSQYSIFKLTKDPIIANSLYASAGSGGLFLSSNDGTNWDLVPGLPSGNAIMNLGIAGDKLFSLTSNGIYASLYGRSTWGNCEISGGPEL
jgi:hypothetical protein